MINEFFVFKFVLYYLPISLVKMLTLKPALRLFLRPFFFYEFDLNVLETN